MLIHDEVVFFIVAILGIAGIGGALYGVLWLILGVVEQYRERKRFREMMDRIWRSK